MASLRRFRHINFHISSNGKESLTRVISRTFGNRDSAFTKLFHFANPETNLDQIAVDSKTVYEFQFESVKPEFTVEYGEKTSLLYKKLHEDGNCPGKLVLLLKCIIGNQDEYLHIWKYPDGYERMDKQLNQTRNNDNNQFVEINTQKNSWCYARENQLCMAFSYFPGTFESHDQDHPIYEVRSYGLQPGTMLEWGQHWSRLNGLPSENIVGAYFSQVGHLYMVHHLWAYRDIAERDTVRENMWLYPGWDDCVKYTARMTREVNTQIYTTTL